MLADAEVFLDTNVLLYAALGRKTEPQKFEAARRIILEEDYSTSGQVLAEFYSNAIKKKNGMPLEPERAQQWVETISRKPCQPVDDQVVKAGIRLSQRYQISYWDGAIIAAAQRLGCKTLYSEDLSHGQTFDTLTVINPFL